MLRMIRFVLVTTLLLLIYAFVLAPPLQTTISELQKAFDSSGLTGTVIGRTTAFMFIGLPLLLLGGALLVAFFVAVGLRGTSFR